MRSMQGQWLLLLCLLGAGPFAWVQQSPVSTECAEYDVISYEAPHKDWPGSLTVERRPDLPTGPDAATATHLSPQGTASYIVREPDTMRPGPWTTVVDISGNKARPLNLRIRFTDHLSGGVRVSWLNEKLLWLQMWRGRLVSTDAILDVETGVFLYQQDANYGSLVIPCSIKPGVPK